MNVIITIDKSNIDQLDRFLHLMKATGTSERINATIVASPSVRAQAYERAAEFEVVFSSANWAETFGSYQDSTVAGRNRQFYHCIHNGIALNTQFIIVDPSCIPLQRNWFELMEEEWRELGSPLALLHQNGDFHKHVGLFSEGFYRKFKFWTGFYGEQLWNQIGKYQLQVDTKDSPNVVDGSILQAIKQSGTISGMITEVVIHLPEKAYLAYNGSDSLSDLISEDLGQPAPDPTPNVSQLEEMVKTLRGAGYSVFAPSDETAPDEDESPAVRLEELVDKEKKIIDYPVISVTVDPQVVTQEEPPTVEDLPVIKRRSRKDKL